MRWLRFYLVGAMGAVVQAAVLYLLMEFAGFDYLTATGLAVEAAILHNYVWHVHWTFSDRRHALNEQNRLARRASPGNRLSKSFVRFQFQAGLISIPGNLACMWMLVEGFHLPAAAANAISIAACSLANFALADRFSFRHHASRIP